MGTTISSRGLPVRGGVTKGNMAVLYLNRDEAALLIRILDAYLAELKQAADGRRTDLTLRWKKEQPLLRDVLAQLMSQRAA